MPDLWYKDSVFYEVYLRAFFDRNNDGHGDLLGLVQKLDYLKELGIDCIWLQPIYSSPLRDDGYDISNYYEVLPAYGTLADFQALVDAVHLRGMRLIADLVLNHTSDQHPWFQSARSSRTSPYRDYYVWSDSDQKYKGTRIIFLDTESSNWTWDEKSGQYYWHRFYASQPDLNFDNPKVQNEMLNIVRFWLDLGIDGFRTDAVPYLFEREGTNCENLPETHAYLKRLRAFMDEFYPGRILLCEANQWPRDVRPYFGDGDEFHMGFNFPIMPRLYMALKKGKKDDLVEITQQTPSIPDNCQWCTFLRNHDELTLEMVTEEDRQWMWREYAPIPRMRLNLGIRRRLAPLLDNDRRKIELANSLLFTLPGSPIIYYGDEIGMGDNIWLDDRNGVRTPMQWDNSQYGGFTSAEPYAPLLDGRYAPEHVNVARQMIDPDSLLHTMQRMIKIRKQYRLFGWGDFEWIDAGTNSIAAYLRNDKNETMLVLNNLSNQKQTAQLPFRTATNIFSKETTPLVSLTLQPFQYLWLLINK
jgi:maltose alpha-D-glucosyltransferase / alpha-amylase